MEHYLTFLIILLGITVAVGFLPSKSFISSKEVQSIQNVQKFNTQLLTQTTYGHLLVQQRNNLHVKDILGLGPAEIAVVLVVGLVLFGPETLKSLSKDVGRAAAELKEIPKTFKQGMDEGAAASEVDKMKALAAEKRKKRDEKLASLKEDDSEIETETEQVNQ